MAHIKKVQVGQTSYLIEPTLYITPSLSSGVYSSSLTDFALDTGVAIQVQFTDTNPDNAQLKINNDTKYIYYNGNKIAANTFKTNHTYTLVYDGIQWQVVGDIDTNTTISHTHGNIQNDGKLQTTDVTIADGDKLVITDASNSNKIARASINFDGSTTTKALTQKGTWETFNNYTHPTTSGNKHIPSGGSSGQFLGWSADGTATWVNNPNTNTHRPIKMNGTEILGNNTTALNLVAGNHIQLTNSSGAVTITNTLTAADLGLSNAMHFIGIATVAITDGSTTNPTISGYDFGTNGANAKPGDVVIDKDSAYEYVWTTANKWEKLGGDSSYKITQTAVTKPTAATNKWVSAIGQNANGVIDVSYTSLDTTGSWTGKITRAGISTSWNKGRNNALIWMSALNGYSPAIALKTKAGSWDIGTCDANNYQEDLIFSYVPDTLYNGTNSTPVQIKFLENGHIVATLDGNASTATWATLIKPIASTTTASASTWNIPSGSYQVWGERFSDTRLKYTPSGGSESTVTDTGDWTMWLTSGGTTNTATLNMRIDGTYYGSFSGNLSGNATTATALTSNAGGTEQPIYFSDGKPAATTYSLSATINAGTANRIAYYSGANAISSGTITSDGGYLGGISYLSVNTAHQTSYRAYINGATYINGNTTHNGIVYFANGTSYYINNSAVGYLPDFRVDKTRLEDNWIGFYSAANAGGSRYGYIQTAQNEMLFRKENGTEGTRQKFSFNGDLTPSATNTYTLGNTSARWSKLYLGTADSYGDAYTPIYWNDGVPAEVAVVQKYTFSIANASTTAVIAPTNTNKAKSIVTEIVVDSGIEYLNGPISWEIPTTGTNKDKIVLTTIATSGAVSGYILVSIG